MVRRSFPTEDPMTRSSALAVDMIAAVAPARISPERTGGRLESAIIGIIYSALPPGSMEISG